MGRSSHAGTVSQVQLLVGSKFKSYNTAPAVSNFPAVYIAAVLQNGNEAIRPQPEVTGLYEARGTTYMYAGRHDDMLTDYSLAIELDPTKAGLWRRRSHACTAADHRDTSSRELGTKKGRCDQSPNHAPEVTRRLNETVAAGRRNPVKIAGHRSCFFDGSRNRLLPTHG